MMPLLRYGAIVTRRTLQLTMLENGLPAVKLFSPVADQLLFSEIHDTVRCMYSCYHYFRFFLISYAVYLRRRLRCFKISDQNSFMFKMAGKYGDIKRINVSYSLFTKNPPNRRRGNITTGPKAVAVSTDDVSVEIA